jgi:NAD(P)H-flavin reductase
VSTPNPLVPNVYRVAENISESTDIATLYLEPPAGTQYQGAPGQFNMLYAFGIGEVPVSISRGPTADGLIGHTIRAVGATTKALIGLQPGDSIGLRGPYGSSWPLEITKRKDVLLVAGGLGLVPLRPVIDQIIANRSAYGHVVLLYGVQSPENIVYVSELDSWASQHDFEVELTVDRATAGWLGNVGIVTDLIQNITLEPTNTVAMICGPGLMMRFSVAALENTGWDSTSIFLSMERNMKCAIGMCGRCQYGPTFICKDGPVFNYSQIEHLFRIAGI